MSRWLSAFLVIGALSLQDRDLESSLITGSRSRHLIRKGMQDKVALELDTSQHLNNDTFEGLREADGHGKQGMLCLEGKQVPQLYVLGAQKAGTSHFYSEMHRVGVEAPETPFSNLHKEQHFFDGGLELLEGDVHWTAHDGIQKADTSLLESASEERAFQWKASMMTQERDQAMANWLKYMPPCKDTAPDGGQRILGDFTPKNLCLVPHAEIVPRSSVKLGSVEVWPLDGCISPVESKALKRLDHGSSLGDSFAVSSMSLPKILQKFYGPEKKKLTFVVVLRDPLRRMRSQHSMQRSKNKGTVGSHGETFNDYVRDCLAALQSPTPAYCSALARSMYAMQLREYLSVFDASQFMVAPSIYFAKHQSEFFNDVLKRLDVDVRVDSDRIERAAEEWNNARRRAYSKASDVSDELQQAFDQAMKPEMDDLAKVLAAMHAGHAHLAGFQGAANANATDPELIRSVRDWIVGGW